MSSLPLQYGDVKEREAAQQAAIAKAEQAIRDATKEWERVMSLAWTGANARKWKRKSEAQSRREYQAEAKINAAKRALLRLKEQMAKEDKAQA
jgi:multidrug resistance efflux pump